MLQRRKHPPSGIRREPEREWPRHQKWVRGFCCAAMRADQAGCSGSIEVAHVRSGGTGGMGLKPPAWFTLPLCSEHHRLQHTIGEPAFERRFGLDMRKEALRLARLSPDKGMRAAMGGLVL